MINRRGMASKARLRLELPSGAREYRGVVRQVTTDKVEGEAGKVRYTLTFQALWTTSFPAWRGWV